MGLFRSKAKRIAAKKRKLAKVSPTSRKGKRLQKQIGRISDRLVRKKARKSLSFKEKAKFLPLAPFRPLMVKQLKKRGFNTRQMPLSTLVTTFYEQVVRKNKKDYEVGVREDLSNIDFQSVDAVDSLEPVTISLIVSAVLAFFRTASASKSTKEERSIAADVEKVERQIEEEKKAEAAVSMASATLNQHFIPIAVGLVGVVVLFGFFKDK